MVVTIIGILAAIAVPSYIHAVEQGRRDACQTNVNILFTQVERYRLVTGQKVPTDRDLVKFLKDQGYLAGNDLKCPFGGKDLNPEYKLEYKGDEATVYCTHCSPPGN